MWPRERAAVIGVPVHVEAEGAGEFGFG